jgi:hypothetical protein
MSGYFERCVAAVFQAVIIATAHALNHGDKDNVVGGHFSFSLINQLKAIETYHFRPRYAGANLGHPSSS